MPSICFVATSQNIRLLRRSDNAKLLQPRLITTIYTLLCVVTEHMHVKITNNYLDPSTTCCESISLQCEVFLDHCEVFSVALSLIGDCCSPCKWRSNESIQCALNPHVELIAIGICSFIRKLSQAWSRISSQYSITDWQWMFFYDFIFASLSNLSIYRLNMIICFSKTQGEIIT